MILIISKTIRNKRLLLREIKKSFKDFIIYVEDFDMMMYFLKYDTPCSDAYYDIVRSRFLDNNGKVLEGILIINKADYRFFSKKYIILNFKEI